MNYRGYEITERSAVGGKNISKDGEYVDWAASTELAYYIIDQLEDAK